jgi:hypothetical protein
LAADFIYVNKNDILDWRIHYDKPVRKHKKRTSAMGEKMQGAFEDTADRLNYKRDELVAEKQSEEAGNSIEIS